jgi:hypothetical protein
MSRPLIRLESSSNRARIGHNGGPPLELTSNALLWRRASARAWKTPPREIALRRLAQAEAAGLTYHEFTAVLMDRGRRLSALVFAPGTVDPRRPEVRRKFAGLGNPKVLLLLQRRPGAWTPGSEQQLASKPTTIRWLPAGPYVEATAGAVARFLAEHALVPGEAVMIGASGDDLAAAEHAGLAVFKWASDFFAGA